MEPIRRTRNQMPTATGTTSAEVDQTVQQVNPSSTNEFQEMMSTVKELQRNYLTLQQENEQLKKKVEKESMDISQQLVESKRHYGYESTIGSRRRKDEYFSY